MSNSGSLPVDPSSDNASLNAGLNTTNDGERISRGLVSVEGSINSHSTLKESDSVQNPPMNMQGFATGHPIAGVNGYNISSEYVPMQPQPPQGLELSHNGQQRMDTEPHGLGMPLQPLLSMGAGSANVPGSVMRAPTLAGFQMSGLQGGQMPMSNVNIAQGGPLLSSGITNAKNMQAHNLTSTESFVAMQPQGMMHTQQQLLPSASGAMTAGNPVMTSSPHTVGLSQPQNIPLNTFLTSSHNLASQQVNMSNQQQAPSLVLQQPGGQQGQPLLMSVDGMSQHGGGQQVPQMQNAQQWMQMRPNNIAPGGNAPPQMQMMQQQQQHGMPPSNQQGQGQGQSQPQMQQYHMQNPGQGQQMQQYGQPQQQQMQGQVHQQQQQMPPPHQQHQVQQQQQQQQQQQMHLNVIPNPQQQQQQMQQQQQPQSQASFAGTKFNTKLWHSGEHAGIRNSLTEEIIKLLRTRRPNATEDWYEKLPHMARRLEDALYHEADSLQEYSDSTTLKHRLQNLALSMGNNKSQQQGQQPVPQNKGAPGGPPQQQQQQQMNPNQMRQQQQYQQQMHQKPYPQQTGQPQNQQMQGQFNPQQQQFQQMRTAQAAASQYPQQGGNPQQPGMAPQQGYLSSGALEYQQQQLNAQQMQMQGGQQQGGMHLQGQPMMHSNMQYGNQGQMMMNGNPQGQVVNPVPAYMINQGDAPNNVQMGSMQYAPMQGGMNRPGGMPNVNIIGMQPQQGQMMHGQGMPQGGSMHPNGQMMQGGNPNAQLGPAGPGGHTEEHRKQVLKQQQQRLLLLRHASKCPHDNGRCPVTPHCWSMKQLWKHIMSCKDQECKIPHCVSSRYVLSHYSKCKEPTCPVCGPVREAIKRNYERSRDIVKATRTSSGSFTGQMPAHAPPQRDEPPAKRQKKKDAGKDKADERHLQPTLVIPNRPRPPPRSVYPLDPISCAIYSFSTEDIQAHFKSIHEGMKLTVAKIREMCKPIVEELYKVPHAHGIFGTPVDPVALGLPDYFDVIKVPMDLGTVMKKLSDGSYRDLHHFVIDVHLTFDNAMNYNPKNSDVYVLAKSLKKDFDIKYRQKVSDFEKNLAIMRENPEACLICGEISLKFEPPVYYCNGTCAQRIRRNAVFFSNNTNTYHWCNPCFNNLKENEVVRLPDCSISKGELLRNKKKHIEESEEGWVQCEGGCQRWVHQVCSLFNARRNISDEVSYVCPLCIQAERQKRPDALIVQPTTKKMSAADLPLTILSQFLEKRIYKRLAIAYKENAQKLGVSENDVEKCPPLILRQVSSQDKMHTVREGVYNRYKEKGYPTDFPCRSKCLVLFQNIDGQDVVLFGMYVYEYGHKCPQPNQRRVYISYLDSVHYLRPKQYRTLVYHEILISYLDYVRARGFHTAHIWACPPQKGDDYILYVHPPDQKTPKPQILRVWYDEMIKRCVERGIVCEYTDFHTEYLVDHSNDATVLPYFEGDYWVNEAEVIIKNLKTGVKDDDDDGGGAGAKSKRKSKSKRLVRTDQVKPISLGKSERDPVMAKLASIIEPMKDTFFVARLHPREYAAKCAENRTAELTAANSTGESTDQQEEKLREEALTGSDVQMPAGAAAPDKLPANGSSANLSGAQGEDEQGGDKDEQQSGAEDQMDDDDDDFGKAASAIALPGNDTGSGDAEGDGDGSLGPARRSISTMQFSDFTALQRAESFTSQAIQELEGKGDGNFGEDGGMRVEESPAEAGAAASTETTAVAGRGTRSTRAKPKSDVKVKSEDGSADADEGDGAMDTADSPTKEAAVKSEPDGASACDGIDDSKLESKEDQVITSGIKAEKYASHMHASPVPSKSSGHVKNTAEPEAAAESTPTATASEETKVKSEDSSDAVKSEDGEEGAKSPRTPGVVVAPVLIMAGEDMPDLKDDTEDVDDVQENEHFETRQSFLNLCQGNHYQFDQLRRAKHTSMMVLYHLHNPDAPKFVPSCNLCHIDILTGYRHHCDTCEIDYCQNCVSNSVMRIHPHPLRPMAIANSAPQQLTEEQRRERARSVQLHMQLLQHAANCVKCESKNCHRMKEFLKHDGVCTVKTVGGCRLCARISNLLNIHARSCRVEGCKVPHCLELREQMRKLTLRQQQMDDRRRQNMNSEYGRAGGSTGTEAPLEDA